MKYIILFLFPLQVLAQVQNCQLECPSQGDANQSESASYEQYRQRQACLSACEQSNRQERQLQAQEEDLTRQKSEIDKQKQRIDEQETSLKQLQERVNEMEANQ